MLEIGINRKLNLALGEAKGDDQFIMKFAVGAKPKSVMELFASQEDLETNNIYIFGPKVADKKGAVKDFMLIAEDLRTTYFIYRGLFELYLTAEEITEHFGPEILYGDYKINEDNQVAMMTNQTVVNKIFQGICKRANEVITFFSLDKEKPLKLKLYRQSPEKAMPRYTYKPLFKNWCELDEVSDEETIVKWTDYEKSKGFNNPLPLEKDATKAAPKNFATPGDVNEAPATDTIPSAKDLPFK
jgi:hypothetical protein